MADVAPETILVFVSNKRDDALGENIIRLPFLYALRTLWPNARLSWVSGAGQPFFAGLLEPIAHGMIDEFITDLSFKDRFSALFSCERPMKGRTFDLIIDLQKKTFVTAQIRRIAHKRFISSAFGWLLSDARPPDGQMRSSRESIRLTSLAAAAAGRVMDIPKTALVPEKWRLAADQILPPGPIYVGLAPGAGNQGRGKLWPLECYIAIARDQIAKGRKPVFILGPGEAHWAPAIKDAVPEALTPGFDETPIPDDVKGPALTIAMARHMAAAVANCAGAAHMLGTGGAPMVTLYGPTNPAKYAPHGVRPLTLRSKDFDGTANIESIPVDAVINAIEEQIKTSHDGPIA